MRAARVEAAAGWGTGSGRRAVLAVLIAVLVAVGSILLMSGSSGAASKAAGSGKAACESADIASGITAAAEVKDLRTTTRRVFRHPCGGLVAQITADPVRYRDGAGRWRSIDNTLVPHGADALRNRANPVTVELPRRLDGQARVSRGDHWVAFSLKDAAGEARVEGTTAMYEDALPGADVRFTVTNAGVKEDIVIEDAAARTEFVYDLDTSAGLTAKEVPGGGIVFEDGAGERVAQFAPPFMHDARRPAHMTSRVSMRLRPGAEGDEVVVSADGDWVRRHLRHGPVTLDPTVSFTPPTDCELDSGAATTSLCSAEAVGVGVTGSGSSLRKRRALLRFSVRRWLPKGAQIFSARLSLTTTKLPSALTSIDVHDPTRSWTSGATWTSYDGTNAWTSPGGDFDSSPISTNTQVGDTLGAREYWTVTSAVQRWADSGSTNGGFGFLLKQTDETSAQGAVEFASSDSAGPGAPYQLTDTPYLTMWYDNMTGDLPYSQFAQSENLTDRLSMAVNVAGGNLLLRAQDLKIAGTGLDLNVDRFYNSREPTAGDLGWGWTFSLGGEIRLSELATGDVVFVGPSGYTKVFRRQSDGTYRHPDGVDAGLVKETSGEWTMSWRRTDEVWRFNSTGSLVEQANRNGRKLTLLYDSSGGLTQVVDSQGRVTQFARNSNGRVSSVTDPTGRVAQAYEYNTSGGGEVAVGGLTTRSTDAAGKATVYGYTGSLLTSITDPLGRTTSFAYDDDRRITSITRGGATTRYDYAQSNTGCANDLNTVVTDAHGKKTTYCWEPPGRVVKVIDATGHERSTTYTADSNVEAMTDGAGGPTTSFGYDANDSLTSGSLPAGETFALTYGDSANQYDPTELRNAQGNRTLFSYDAKGNTTTVRDGASPTGVQAALEYNGQSGGQCPASGPDGTLRCAIDGKGNRTRYGYDTQGNLTTITPELPLGQTTITYDGLSRVKTIQDGKGLTRTYTYDQLDRITRIDYADGSYVSYSYDANGNRTSQADSLNGSWTYAYDERNRRTHDTLPDGATNDYAYDAVSNLTRLTDRTGTVAYAYDDVNRLSALTEPDAQTTTFGYDGRDNRTLTTFPSGVVETRTYDGSNKVKTIRAANGGTILTDFTYTYTNATSRETRLQQTGRDKFGDTTTYSYDGNDRLTRAHTKDGAGSTVDDRAYNYDKANNRTQDTTNGSTYSYAYNAANQLCWRYGGTSSASCGSPPSGATTYTHDANGNLTGSNAGLGFTYNARNQTSSITIGGVTDAAAYGGDGQSDYLKLGPKAFQSNLLGIGIQDGGPYGRADFVREPDGRLFSQLSSGERHHYLLDAQDSVAGIANETGRLDGYLKYDPYGLVRKRVDYTAPLYYEYKSSIYVKNGIYRYGERFYIPSTGRWTQLDPLDQPSDLRQANRYVYVGGDPVNRRDPTGTDFCDVFFDVAYGPYTPGPSTDGLLVTPCDLAEAIEGVDPDLSPELENELCKTGARCSVRG